jgi:hypothetical protein
MLAISLFLVVKHTTLPSVSILGLSSNGKWRDVAVAKEAHLIPVFIVENLLFVSSIDFLIDFQGCFGDSN